MCRTAAFVSKRHHGCDHGELQFFSLPATLQDDAEDEKSENQKARTWSAREMSKITADKVSIRIIVLI